MPSKIELTVSLILLMYVPTAPIQTSDDRTDVNLHPRLAQVVNHAPEEDHQHYESVRRHVIARHRVAVGPKRDPKRGADHIDEGDRNEVLPAQRHELVDSHARQ